MCTDFIKFSFCRFFVMFSFEHYLTTKSFQRHQYFACYKRALSNWSIVLVWHTTYLAESVNHSQLVLPWNNTGNKKLFCALTCFKKFLILENRDHWFESGHDQYFFRSKIFSFSFNFQINVYLLVLFFLFCFCRLICPSMDYSKKYSILITLITRFWYTMNDRVILVPWCFSVNFWSSIL